MPLSGGGHSEGKETHVLHTALDSHLNGTHWKRRCFDAIQREAASNREAKLQKRRMQQERIAQLRMVRVIQPKHQACSVRDHRDAVHGGKALPAPIPVKAILPMDGVRSHQPPRSKAPPCLYKSSDFQCPPACLQRLLRRAQERRKAKMKEYLCSPEQQATHSQHEEGFGFPLSDAAARALDEGSDLRSAPPSRPPLRRETERRTSEPPTPTPRPPLRRDASPQPAQTAGPSMDTPSSFSPRPAAPPQPLAPTAKPRVDVAPRHAEPQQPESPDMQAFDPTNPYAQMPKLGRSNAPPGASRSLVHSSKIPVRRRQAPPPPPSKPVLLTKMEARQAERQARWAALKAKKEQKRLVVRVAR